MPTARSRRGTRGERIAREHLEAKGYKTIATNFRCQWGEVDIVSQQGPCLVFVEVRTRTNPSQFGTPEESISKQKRDRLVATAETYIQDLPTPPEEWRIDLVSVRLDGLGGVEQVRHLENAVELS